MLKVDGLLVIFTASLSIISTNIISGISLLGINLEIFLKSLSSKELLVYSIDDIYDLFMGYLSNITIIKGKMLSKVTREFMNYEFNLATMVLSAAILHYLISLSLSFSLSLFSFYLPWKISMTSASPTL